MATKPTPTSPIRSRSTRHALYFFPMSSMAPSIFSFSQTSLFAWILACSTFAAGQTITIRLINGETGKSMKNLNVTLQWDKDFKSSVVFIGAEGVGHVDILQGATAFHMMEGPKIGKEANRIAYTNCNQGPTTLLKVEEILKFGVVPANTCGSKKLTPKAGEVIFWGRPRRSWEPDLQ
jgi:hypothetical protein